jgi:hypothetical protein
MLDQLTNLTHLAIAGCAHQPATALASLSRLRSLCWLVVYSPDDPPVHYLPEGWLTNLRQLAAPLWCMASSQAAVDSMPQLPQLRSLVIPEGLATSAGCAGRRSTLIRRRCIWRSPISI